MSAYEGLCPCCGEIECQKESPMTANELPALSRWLDFWTTYSALNEGAQDDMDAERHAVLDEMRAALAAAPVVSLFASPLKPDPAGVVVTEGMVEAALIAYHATATRPGNWPHMFESWGRQREETKMRLTLTAALSGGAVASDGAMEWPEVYGDAPTDGGDGRMYPEDCATWLDRKYARHHEPEDRACAKMIRLLAVALRNANVRLRATHPAPAAPEGFVMDAVRDLLRYGNTFHETETVSVRSPVFIVAAERIERLREALSAAPPSPSPDAQPAGGEVSDAMQEVFDCMLRAVNDLNSTGSASRLGFAPTWIESWAKSLYFVAGMRPSNPKAADIRRTLERWPDAVGRGSEGGSDG